MIKTLYVHFILFKLDALRNERILVDKLIIDGYSRLPTEWGGPSDETGVTKYYEPG
jgi:hypothetical protein